MYCAERLGGPFANHYISFASKPQLIEVEGVDFCDKVDRIYRTNLCDSTNIEGTFDLILNTAIKNNLKQEDMPQTVVILSDMEFNAARGYYGWGANNNTPQETLMETIEKKWNEAGYTLPKLIFWNVCARQNNIPMKDQDGITFVSGFSQNLFNQILQGKDGQALMYDVLDNDRYKNIH